MRDGKDDRRFDGGDREESLRTQVPRNPAFESEQEMMPSPEARDVVKTPTPIASPADFQARRVNPAAHYRDPAAIVADNSLTRTQRLQLLHDWAQDLVDRQIATGEGMPPATPAVDTLLLRQVNICIETVEATPEDPANLLVRLWRRLLAI